MMKTLSIFIDESGDFGEFDGNSPYYLVTLIFHDQKKKISSCINQFEQELAYIGFENETIHTGPIIRREQQYSHLSIDDRKKLLYKMLSFYRHAPITHRTAIVTKKNAPRQYENSNLQEKLTQAIQDIIDSNLLFILNYDKIIVYYDNGQKQLNSSIKSIFDPKFNNVELRKAPPQKYRLLQLADFVCSLELLNLKFNDKNLSKSEEKFFYKPQELKKTFLKALKEKTLKP